MRVPGRMRNGYECNLPTIIDEALRLQQGRPVTSHGCSPYGPGSLVGGRESEIGGIGRIIRFLVVLLMLATARTAFGAAPVIAPRPLDAIINSVGRQYVADSPKHALVIGISSPEGTRVRGFGAHGSETPDGDTLFEIGSITKTMTGTLLAEFVLQGQAHLDDPVRDYFPEDWSIPRRDGRDISLLHLATHTSSLPRMPPDFLGFMVVEALSGTDSRDDPYAHYDLADLKSSLEKIELTRPIGSQMVYSNLGAGLLGQALARAADKDDPAPLFEESLLEPLGMADTHFEIPPKSRSRLAQPFEADGDPAHIWHFAALKACGGLRSSVHDLLRYGDAATGRVETPLRPAFEFALQPWRDIGSERFIALGWFRRPVELPGRDGATTTLVWHSGATGGYRSFIAILPEHGTTLVVLSNTTKQLDPDVVWPILDEILAGI